MAVDSLGKMGGVGDLGTSELGKEGGLYKVAWEIEVWELSVSR